VSESGFLEGNLEAIGRRFPGLAELLRDEAAGAEGALVLSDTPSGAMSARVPGGLWLHSSRDPRAEARRLAEGLAADSEGAPGSAEALVILGFGLGYLAEAALGRGGAGGGPGAAALPGGAAGGASADGPSEVIVCEAEPRALAAALRARDLRELLADERLGFVLGGDPDAAVSALERGRASRAVVRGLSAAEAARPDWYASVRAAVGRWNAKGEVNAATLRRFGRLWVRNLAANLDRIAACPGVDRLEGLASGLPAVVLAAGPSLDLVLPSLREIAQRAVVVCVDTALRSVLAAGLEPDFLVLVDPQYWNWRHVAGLPSPRSILVSESAAWPAVFRMAKRAAFLGGSLFPLGRRIESFAGRKGSLGAGGSVATSAWDLARLMGAAPIWTAGLDLGYPGGLTHAGASMFEQRAFAAAGRLAPASRSQAAALLEGHPFEAPAAGGGMVLTDARMRLYAWWFESRLARASSPRTRSLSPSGLAVPGMEVGSLDELLALPPARERIDELCARAAAMEAPPEARAGARAGLAALLGELHDIAETASGAAAAAARGRSKLAAGGSCRAELAALDGADALLLGNEARDLAGFLLPSAAELVGRRASDLDECLARSESIYRSVADSAAYHLERLGRSANPEDEPAI
jgi:hypothetical protein